LDYFDHWYLVTLARISKHRRTCRVACDNNRFHALGNKAIHNFKCECSDISERSRAIGATRGVAEVDD
jgi:hypothetical protein